MSDPGPRPGPSTAPADVCVVIVAYGPEPWLGDAVRAVLGSEGVRAEVVLVDNGGTDGAVDELARLAGVTAISPGGNVGFATGCNLGVEASAAPVVALVNPDAIVEPKALAELTRVALDPEVAIATASVRLADDPDRLNCAGNDVHFLGASWAGRFDEPAADHDVERAVAAASGAAMACRREVWQALGGFCDELFAYYEDAELSLRAWQRGWSVVYVPSAVVRHRYEFSRNPLKLRLLERNRLIVVLTCFPSRHLLVVAPLLAALELAILVYAWRDGWRHEKLAGYVWLARHVRWLRRRRRQVQAARRRDDGEVAALLSEHLRPANVSLPAYAASADRVLAGWWALARRLL